MQKKDLSNIGEFGLIKQIENICRKGGRNVLIDIGDDAAAVRTGSKTTLLCSDMLTEGVHFDLKTTSCRQLGHKILAVNLSDIFAMGGKPKYFLLNLAIPSACSANDIKDIYRGIKRLADRHGVSVVGGDTVSSKAGLVLSGTLVGETDRVISRKGARPGDSIFITGTPGDSAMGLEILKQGAGHRVKGTGKRALCKKHLMPEPEPIKRKKDITAMIDISDGLLADLSHICDESKAGAVINTDRIPLSDALISVCNTAKKDPLEYALKGGEDFILLFTSSAKKKKGAVRIGEIIKSGRYIIDSHGKKRRFKAEGYEHFK